MPPKIFCANCKLGELERQRDTFATDVEYDALKDGTYPHISRRNLSKWRYYNRLTERWKERIKWSKDVRSLHPCSPFCRSEMLEYRSQRNIERKNTRNIRRQKYIIADKAWQRSKGTLFLLIKDLGWEHPEVKKQEARVYHLALVRSQRLRRLREVSKR